MVNVSIVVNVFDETIIRVFEGSKSAVTLIKSLGSIFDTNLTSMLLLKGVNALTDILGPRSEPPIPIAKTDVYFLPL